MVPHVQRHESVKTRTSSRASGFIIENKIVETLGFEGLTVSFATIKPCC
jgi:hypothetical protein